MNTDTQTNLQVYDLLVSKGAQCTCKRIKHTHQHAREGPDVRLPNNLEMDASGMLVTKTKGGPKKGRKAGVTSVPGM
jgi:hypothetical protein